jgi:ATP-dependent protease ClpP protease subunit
VTVHVIVGASCSGKSTHAWENRAKDEPVVDFDRLASALGAATAHGAEGAIADAAFAARAAARRAAMSADVDGWVLHTTPTQKHIDEYVDADADFVLLDPGEDECVARAEADGRPEGTVDRIRAWYEDPPQLPEGTTTITDFTRGTPMSRSATSRATPAQAHKQNRYWGEKDLPTSKVEFFNAVTTPAPAGDGGTVATIRMYGPIDSWGGFWGISTKDIGGVLDALPETVTQIILRINSPGGEVFEGVSILNMLRAHKASVTAVVDGLAASAASFIAAGCDDTVMSPGTQMMIHSPLVFSYGNAAELRKTADILDSIESSIVEIYTGKAGEKDWAGLLAADTWLNASQAVDLGLANRVGVIPDAGEAITVTDDDELEVITLDDDEIEDSAARARITRFPERAAARTPTLPRATAPGTSTGQETAMADLNATIRARLGLLDSNASDEVIVAALDEALAERAEPTAAAAVPDGATMVDAGVFAQMQSDAAAGREARAQQETERRDRVVAEALQDGRIAPATQATWRAQLDTNEEGTTQLLASLPKNTIPVTEIGTAAGDAVASDEDRAYATVFGAEKKEA